MVLMTTSEERRISLGGAVRFADAQVDQQAVAILHERVLRVRQLGLFTFGLAGQLRLAIGLRFVRRVGTLRDLENDARFMFAGGTARHYSTRDSATCLVADYRVSFNVQRFREAERPNT